jgi:CheY-like chemotaxis protein
MTTILVVDDESTIRELLTAVLTDEGYAVLTAENGGQALDVIRSEEPHVVIMDIMMPVLDGRRVVEEIERLDIKRKPRVVLMSAAIRAARQGAGYVEFLPKPFDLHDLLATIDRAMSDGAQPPAS